MTGILPNYSGLNVNTVSYRYTVTKEVVDPYVVTIQNLNAQGSGYTFRTRDDWTGIPGNNITRTVPVASIPIQYWGRGEITTTGIGELRNPYVIYNYTYDTCSGPVITDTRCPNYKPPLPTISTDSGLDDLTKKILDYKPTLADEESEKNNKLFSKEPPNKKRSELVSKTIQNSLITAEAAAQASAFQALNNIPNYSVYYKTIPGGVYPDALKYPDKRLPDSKNSLRLNFSQERLHNLLVDSQYKKD